MAKNQTRTTRTPTRPAAQAADPGYITVRVGKLPGRISDVALNGGRKVRDALDGAELSANGFEIKVNTVPATLDTELKTGDTVLLVRKTRSA